MSSGFGAWYEEQKAQENGASEASAGGDQMLPLWGDTSQYSFSSFRSSMEAQLPQQILGMNYQQRFRVFCALLFVSALFFALAFTVGLPMLAIRPQKFALSFTFGSLLFMSSFAILKGPMAHLQSLFVRERLLFTTIYFLSIFSTLYLTFTHGGASGYVLVMGASGCQLMALLWYLISFLPGGSAGLSIVLSAMWRVLQPVFVMCAKLQAACMARCFSWMTSSSTASQT
jgi:hypothetical protein